MNDVKKKLDAVYSWISRISVSGDNVDFLAMARQELRNAYKLLEEVNSDG